MHENPFMPQAEQEGAAVRGGGGWGGGGWRETSVSAGCVSRESQMSHVCGFISTGQSAVLLYVVT